MTLSIYVCSVNMTSVGCVWMSGNSTTPQLEATSSESHTHKHTHGVSSLFVLCCVGRCNRYEVRRKADGELQKRKEQVSEPAGSCCTSTVYTLSRQSCTHSVCMYTCTMAAGCIDYGGDGGGGADEEVHALQ